MSPDSTHRLRTLAFNNPSARDATAGVEVCSLDVKSLSLARLAALAAVGADETSFGELTDAAVTAGASADDMVDVLVGVSGIVGAPRVVDAAFKLAVALGDDLRTARD